MTHDEIKAQAARLVRDAAVAGLTVTIEQVALQPPAMGNYKTIVSVHPAHPRSLQVARRPNPAHGAPNPPGHNPVA